MAVVHSVTDIQYVSEAGSVSVCSQDITYICECFCGNQWLRIARSKGSDRVGASCLKKEADPASETYYFSVYTCHTMDRIEKEECI